jgi:hypothetical protein
VLCFLLGGSSLYHSDSFNASTLGSFEFEVATFVDVQLLQHLNRGRFRVLVSLASLWKSAFEAISVWIVKPLARWKRSVRMGKV